ARHRSPGRLGSVGGRELDARGSVGLGERDPGRAAGTASADRASVRAALPGRSDGYAGRRSLMEIGMSDARASDRPAVRIELETERAWCGERLLDRAPKAFAILRHFVEHPERLLTKDDLFAALCP